jgi:hypothetical protein
LWCVGCSEIYETVTQGIGDAIKERLNRGYADNPLNKMVDSVVVSREPALRKLIEEAVDGALVGDFRAALKDAVTHKLARVLTSKLEGEIEKRANELRSSPEMRARITLAIEQAVKSASA